MVPERYRFEDTGSDLTPYVLGSATIAGVALLNGLVFQLIANSEADTLNNTSANNPGKNTRPEFEGFEEDQRRLRDTSFGSYIAGAGFAAVALALWSWTLLDRPEGIDEVYEKQPWFDLNPTPGGAAPLNWTWD